MTTIQITLPDALAEEAQQAGLLSPDRIELWLRKELKAQSVDRLDAAINLLAADDSVPYRSPEEVAEEIKIMRAERRAQR